MRKMKYATVVGTLRDLATEGEAYSASGDTRIAAEGRRTTLLATVLLQIVSSIPEDTFNSAKLATVNKGDLADAAREELKEGEEA